METEDDIESEFEHDEVDIWLEWLLDSWLRQVGLHTHGPLNIAETILFYKFT